MTQGMLPFQYEVEKRSDGLTSMGGLPSYFEFSSVMGLCGAIRRHVQVRSGCQGWTDEQMLISLVLLNLAGGECVDDLRVLEGDEGLRRIVIGLEGQGLTRAQRHEIQRRWRKEKKRAFPSPTAMLDYLKLYHDNEWDSMRRPHEAFIPPRSQALCSLAKVNGEFISSVQKRSPQETATLDMDATVVETHKKEALWSYKKCQAYQPLNVYWAEQDLILHTEFRDGNVPANFDLLRLFKESLGFVPQGVRSVYLRSDAAGYQEDLLKFCAEAKSERFGQIEFAIGAPVNAEFKKAILEVEESSWRPLTKSVNGKLVDTNQQYAEVCFVPAWVGHTKHGPEYRFLAVREPLEQQILPGMEKQMCLPFPTMNLANVQYKITGLVTNRTLPGDEVIQWYRERCGKSEQAHSIMKEDLAGGKFPSGLFGVNAAWWHAMILAFNVNSAMKRLVLGNMGHKAPESRSLLAH